MADKIKLCAEALTLIGAGPISSLEGPDARQVAARNLYDAAIEETLCAHRWHFASQAEQLARDSTAPDTRFEASYQLPAGVELIHGCFVNGQAIEFDRFENKIHCDAQETDAVYCEFTIKVDESYWPAYFAALIRLKLAAMFAVAIAEDPNKASIFEGKYVRQMAQARLLDSQGRTAAKMPVGGLAAFVGGGLRQPVRTQ